MRPSPLSTGLFFVSEGIPIFLSVLLFLLIFFINVYFWLSMLKVAFLKQYLWLMKQCACLNIFSKNKGAKGMLEDPSIENDSYARNQSIHEKAEPFAIDGGNSFAIDGGTSFA